MSIDELVLAIVRAYPQIYHACHREHPRARTNVGRISAREAWILGHLDLQRPLSPTTLARHMGIGPSTVSEALKRLEKLGYVTRQRVATDARRMDVCLTTRGAAAMQGASVLDAARVASLVGELSDTDRAKAVAGLTLLADAARALNAKDPPRWPDHDE